MDMINIGYSGASTAQVELNVTAQNTANAMTTGYTRQVAEISTIGASGGSPNSAGNSDNLQALINISTEPLEIANLGSVTVGQACSSIISNIGIYSQQNQTEVDAASNVYSAAQNQQSSVSGVSMDEEAVNLITYQQIYEANLKVISAGAEIFDSVLEMCS